MLFISSFLISHPFSQFRSIGIGMFNLSLKTNPPQPVKAITAIEPRVKMAVVLNIKAPLMVGSPATMNGTNKMEPIRVSKTSNKSRFFIFIAQIDRDNRQ